MKTEPQHKPLWTIEAVVARFEEAVKTANSLPSARVQGYFNVWPAIFQGVGKRQASADPRAVERMQETSRWLQWLDYLKSLLILNKPQNLPTDPSQSLDSANPLYEVGLL